MRSRSKLYSLVIALVLALLALAPATANASTTHRPALRGTTTVTTAPGIAGTLLGAGILPLPTRGTGFGIGFAHGLNVRYGFPVVGANPALAAGTGDILHSGGIDFLSRKAQLEVGKFDIDLAAGKIFATEVNRKPAKVALLDLDLSRLKVATASNTTTLTGISVKLDPAAAAALNATFGIALPIDGSLVFGHATVVLRS